MASLFSDELNDYIESHSPPEGELFRALAQETRKRTESPQMMVGPVQAAFLTMMARLTGAKHALEIGTFTGYSALAIAEGLPDDGTLTTCDINEDTTEIAKRHWAKSPHGGKISLRLGAALETIAVLDGPFDLVFIDADKETYIRYWEACVPKVRPGGIILADNVLWGGEVTAPRDEEGRRLAEFNNHVRNDSRVESVMLSIRDGITMAMRR